METSGTSGIFADDLPGSAALGASIVTLRCRGGSVHSRKLLGVPRGGHAPLQLESGVFKSIVSRVSKEGQIVTEGTVTQVLPGTMFRVDLPGQRNVLAHISGKMRKHFIRIVPGDKVSVELSPYDLTKARIIFREQ